MPTCSPRSSRNLQRALSSLGFDTLSLIGTCRSGWAQLRLESSGPFLQVGSSDHLFRVIKERLWSSGLSIHTLMEVNFSLSHVSPDPLPLLYSATITRPPVQPSSAISGVAAQRREFVSVLDSSADSSTLLRSATTQAPRQTLDVRIGDTVHASHGQRLLARLRLWTSALSGFPYLGCPLAPLLAFFQ
jgi:hypothetical protein